MVRPEILERSAKVAETPLMERIAGLRDVFVKAGDEAQELRHLPAWAAKELADNGLCRHVLPPELGGEGRTAREQIGVVEAVSAVDGSVGWCVQINSEINALVIRRMDVGFAHQLCDDWYLL